MPLTNEERDLAVEQTSVGNFVDNIGRNLFQTERYDDLEAVLGFFCDSNTAGTTAASRAHFFNSRLAPLFTNYHITKYLDIGTELQWETAFPELVGNIDTDLIDESSEEGYTFNEYIRRETSKGRTIASLAEEVRRACLEFKSDV